MNISLLINRHKTLDIVHLTLYNDATGLLKKKKKKIHEY